MNSILKLHVLASGSKGNCYCLQVDNNLIFVDMGVGIRKIQAFLSAIPNEAQLKKTLFITHEHFDHISGLELFARDYDCLIYAANRTLEILTGKVSGIKERVRRIRADEIVEFNGFSARAFSLSHDAVEPLGYVISAGSSIGFLTDTGCWTDAQAKALECAETLVLETNHDVEMLRNNKQYPPELKRRILSPQGHLSNNEAIGLVTTLSCNGKLKSCFFAHVSQHNNGEAHLLPLGEFCQKQFGIKTTILRQDEYREFNLN
ncbi:MBL fold metallo-hydrolase [Deferribacterales bacterium RsTz2092]|nr:putative metallo-hydrolase YycJ [Deferribacterales bacterium]